LIVIMDQSDPLHGNGKKPTGAFRRRCCSGTTAVTLLLFVVTNTVSILVSTGVAAGPSFLRRYKPAAAAIIPFWGDSAALLADLNATQAELAAGRAELAGLYARVGTANELLRTLVEQQRSTATDDGWAREPAGELRLAIGPHGRRNGTELSFPALGHACRRVQDDLERYMSYTPGGECPSDEALERRLVLGGCDPLPRRRCRPRSPKGYAQPLPLPGSLWATPPDTAVVWDAYHPCKNYSCLPGGGGGFDLRRGGRERGRWARDDGALAYSVDAVLRTRPNGTVRIGLDITGSSSSSGTFAARMMELGVTVVTAVVKAGAPFGGFIAARGLVPVQVSAAAHRLPFFDGTLDIVHHLGGGGGPPDDGVMLEFALFDVYRVLRPGGLFWIDHFVCPGGTTKLSNVTFAHMIDRVGFNKLRWNTGHRKLRRRGAGKDECYISALLEKPMA
jgi:SAM-dependent methyltransferase